MKKYSQVSYTKCVQRSPGCQPARFTSETNEQISVKFVSGEFHFATYTHD
jgi:hypothetical protein